MSPPQTSTRLPTNEPPALTRRRARRFAAPAAGGAAVLLAVSAGWAGLAWAAEAQSSALPAEHAASALSERPFAASSPWNTMIASDAQYSAGNAAITRSLTKHTSRAWINAAVYSVGVAVGDSDDPLTTFDVPDASTLQSRVPASAQPARGTDSELAVINGDRSFEYWGARKNGSTWTARFGDVVDLTGSGTTGGVRASGFSLLGGLIRTDELGGIDHALVVALAADQLRSGPVEPARSQDSDAASSYRGVVPMGSLVAIPRTVDLAGLNLSPSGLVLATALQQYGAYVGDRSSALTLYAEPSAESAKLTAMRKDLRSTLAPLLRVVSE